MKTKADGYGNFEATEVTTAEANGKIVLNRRRSKI
jgi:hypothetical protein